MQLPLVLGFLAASAAATPVRNAAVSKMKWSPAAGTTATCDKATDKWISTTVGPEQGSDLLDHACAALMPACAYQENHEGLICAQTIDFAIDGTKTVQLNATVETEETLGKTTAWAANCKPTKSLLYCQFTNLLERSHGHSRTSARRPTGCLLDQGRLRGLFGPASLTDSSSWLPHRGLRPWCG